MRRLGIISGTVLLHDRFPDLGEERLETPYGPATVFCSDGIAMIARHGTDPQCHILPHLINHPANLAALKALGVQDILGIHSTGSLKLGLGPGMLAVPDDYILLGAGPTVIRSEATHIVPALSDSLRRLWLEGARDCGIPCRDGGTYWQTSGPRFETRAEIALMCRFADLVGMTLASEAIIAQELGMRFASVCSVDNFAHGLSDQPLSLEEVSRCARQNARAIHRILLCCLERFQKAPS
jgi:5'-methylthioadenosine phosphorylase